MPQRLPHPPTRACALGFALAFTTSAVMSQAVDAWPQAGQQGLVRYVVVPAAQAREREAYQQQIDRLCEPETTCFVNFYTNSTGAALAMPLPDAIEREATATFRRSMKNGAQRFMWACRLKMGQDPCF